MSNTSEKRRKPHDLGGLPAGRVDRSEHRLNFWEWRIDAMVRLLFQRGILVDFAELRRAVEDLTPDAYNDLTYYERWTAAVATLLVEKGIITRDELEQRMASVQTPIGGQTPIGDQKTPIGDRQA